MAQLCSTEGASPLFISAWQKLMQIHVLELAALREENIVQGVDGCATYGLSNSTSSSKIEEISSKTEKEKLHTPLDDHAHGSTHHGKCAQERAHMLRKIATSNHTASAVASSIASDIPVLSRPKALHAHLRSAAGIGARPPSSESMEDRVHSKPHDKFTKSLSSLDTPPLSALRFCRLRHRDASESKEGALTHYPGDRDSRLENLYSRKTTMKYRPGCLRNIVSSTYFESAFFVLILVNTITMCVHMQHQGLELGEQLGYPGARKLHPSSWKVVMVHVFEIVFGVLFTIEVALKMISFRLQFFRSAWNLFDLSVVLTWFVQQLVMPDDSTSGATSLRVLRLVRILRIARIVKWITMMDPLHILVESIRSSCRIIVWALTIVLVMITIVTLVVQNAVAPYLEDGNYSLEDRRAVYKKFGSFSRASFSIFEITFGNFGPVIELLHDKISEYWCILGMMYKFIFGLTIVTVITGVLMQETFRIASTDDDLLIMRQKRKRQEHLQKMTNLFQKVDSVGTGLLDFDAFKAMVNDPFIKIWLAAYELDTNDVQVLFHLIDDGDGFVTAEELVNGVSRLKGGAKSIDMHTAMMDLAELKYAVAHLLDLLLTSEHSKKIDARNDSLEFL